MIITSYDEEIYYKDESFIINLHKPEFILEELENQYSLQRSVIQALFNLMNKSRIVLEYAHNFNVNLKGINQKVKIIGNTSNHSFNIGDAGRIVKEDNFHRSLLIQRTNQKKSWVKTEDIQVLSDFNANLFLKRKSTFLSYFNFGGSKKNGFYYQNIPIFTSLIVINVFSNSNLQRRIQMQIHNMSICIETSIPLIYLSELNKIMYAIQHL